MHVLVLLAATLLLRAPGFPASVLDPDEGLYIVQALAWLRGGWPFVAVWDMHPLGAPALLLPAAWLLADPVLALRLSGAAAVALTAILLRAIARQCGASRGTALAAGLIYVAHTTILGGLATNTEILFAPLVALAAWLLLRDTVRGGGPRLATMLAAGLSVGLALLVKQVVVFPASAIWLATMLLACRGGAPSPARILALALVFAISAGLPTGIVALGYWLTGHLEPWAYGNLWAAFAYGTQADAPPGLRRGLVKGMAPLLLPVLAATAVWLLPAPHRRMMVPVWAWLLGASLAVAAPWKFYDHYFLILLPPLSLLAASGLGALVQSTIRVGREAGAMAAMVGVVCAMPVAAMLTPRLADGMSLRLADPPRQVAALVREALAPGHPLYVANWHSIVYALAGQPPPTRFAFPVHLTGFYEGLIDADPDAELGRVLALPPGVIVVDPGRWSTIRPEARAAIEGLIADRYDLAGTVRDAGARVEVWRLR
jgi:4-amino-4-deoxy-L-arabinose transferase-like glycosyltransferase